jgi:hypothetical protein
MTPVQLRGNEFFIIDHTGKLRDVTRARRHWLVKICRSSTFQM